jgi:prepilin-type N-terminal cleavage/methylation domain-containing protein
MAHGPLRTLQPQAEFPRLAAESCTENAVRARNGFTLIELIVVLAILAVLIVLASFEFGDWREVEAARAATRSVEGAFSFARGEAIRTGNNHIVFFQQDIAGNPLTDGSGNTVPILVLDDGRPGSANQNCAIDAGETIQPIRIERGVDFGVAQATAQVPIDEGAGPYATGSSFLDAAGGNPATWVMFRSDGQPRSVNAACASGALGTGGGAIYMSNPQRDVAVVLTPLGAARAQTWNGGTSTWN